MNSNLFFKISNKMKYFFKEYKLFCFIVTIILLSGIIFGIYSGITLSEDLEIADMTDTLFVSFLDGEGTFLGFFFTRLIFLALPILILVFINHILICPIVVYFCFARAYFFAFNLTILFCHLNLFGLIYVILVALPCYLLYCILFVPCYSIILKKIFMNRKYKESSCENKAMFKGLFKTILFFIALFCVVILYESTFLFIIFNKYIFSV